MITIRQYLRDDALLRSTLRRLHWIQSIREVVSPVIATKHKVQHFFAFVDHIHDKLNVCEVNLISSVIFSYLDDYIVRLLLQHQLWRPAGLSFFHHIRPTRLRKWFARLKIDDWVDVCDGITSCSPSWAEGQVVDVFDERHIKVRFHRAGDPSSWPEIVPRRRVLPHHCRTSNWRKHATMVDIQLYAGTTFAVWHQAEVVKKIDDIRPTHLRKWFARLKIIVRPVPCNNPQCLVDHNSLHKFNGWGPNICARPNT